MKEYAPSVKTAIKTVYQAFQILKRNDNQLPGKEVMELIEKEVELTDWEKERYEKTGYIRWQSILHFYTIDSMKAGYLQKKNGVWYLTEEGVKAADMSPEDLFESAREAYKKWDSSRPKKIEIEDVSENEENIEQQHSAQLLQLEEQAISSIEDYIRALNPYEFQDLIAALLRGMGYFTPFVAPKGKDHGIDIIAYKDPLGIEKPIMKIQVKHRPDDAIQSQEIQKLKGALSHEEEVGIFVTSGRFSQGALREARSSKSHIETIDFSQFVGFWKQFYSKLSDEDKNLLPLYEISFLGKRE